MINLEAKIIWDKNVLFDKFWNRNVEGLNGLSVVPYKLKFKIFGYR